MHLLVGIMTAVHYALESSIAVQVCIAMSITFFCTDLKLRVKLFHTDHLKHEKATDGVQILIYGMQIKLKDGCFSSPSVRNINDLTLCFLCQGGFSPAAL